MIRVVLVLGGKVIRVEHHKDEHDAGEYAKAWLNGARVAKQICGLGGRTPEVFIGEPVPAQIEAQVADMIPEA